MIQDSVFLMLATITLAGAVMAVGLRNVFYNALALILCLFGVAGLFIYLNAEFLAIMEVIIYIGAISIAIIFAIMLSQQMFPQDNKRSIVKTLRAALIGGSLFAGLLKTFQGANWSKASSATGDYSLRAIGKNLLGPAVLPFEAVSLVLLIAIIGALLISNSGEKS